MKREEIEEDIRWGRLTNNDAREIIGRSEGQEIESTYSPSRAIITRDAVRELVRQLDPPNDCPYCRGGDAQHNREMFDDDRTLAYIDWRRLLIETFDIDGDPTEVSVKVNYCPKCGGKLEAKP